MRAQQSMTTRLIRIGVIALTLGTALTHMSLLFPDPVFLLNGIGYLVLLAALYLPIGGLTPYRRQFRWLLIGYIVLTIVLWVAFGSRIMIGYINKINELLLLGLLVWEDHRNRSSSRA